MSIHVFAGPSLPSALRPSGPFEWHPPAQAGDMLRLAEREPTSVCLIDGYFDWCPAPWHKELLLLLSRGFRLFGAASMGALRAAELEPFGMTGIGIIFRAYRDGRLEGDDEVALIHAVAELDWAPLSVPLVELRATLVTACRAGIVTPAAARRLRERAKEIHFEDRDRPALARAWSRDGIVPEDVAERIAALHVPLKRLDALACLEAALQPSAAPEMRAPPPVTCFMTGLATELGLEWAPTGS